MRLCGCSNGSLTETDLQLIEAEAAAAAEKGENGDRGEAWPWPDGLKRVQQASAQAWRPLASAAAALDSDAASDTATTGSELTFAPRVESVSREPLSHHGATESSSTAPLAPWRI